MSVNIDVKALSNLYTDVSTVAFWICTGCLASMASGTFKVFGACCCRFPVFGADDDMLKQGMCAVDEGGLTHRIRRCCGCLITGRPCIAPPEDFEAPLKLLHTQLVVIYDDSKKDQHPQAMTKAMTLCQSMRKMLDRAPYVPHSDHLRLHNGATSVDEAASSYVRPPSASKANSSKRARDRAEELHTEELVAKKLKGLQDSPGGRRSKVSFDSQEAITELAAAKEKLESLLDQRLAHVASNRPKTGKARVTWDNKSTRFDTQVKNARDAVREAEMRVKRGS